MELYPPEWKEWFLDVWVGLKEVSKEPIRMLRRTSTILSMGRTRRGILAAYALAVCLLCVYVPWEARVSAVYSDATLTVSLGYGFLWSPPEKRIETYPSPVNVAQVSIARVVLALVALTAATGCALIVLPRERGRPRS